MSSKIVDELRPGINGQVFKIKMDKSWSCRHDIMQPYAGGWMSRSMITMIKGRKMIRRMISIKTPRQITG